MLVNRVSAYTKNALFAVSIVFNYDGTGTVMKDVEAVPATRIQTIPFKATQGEQAPLARFDMLLPDCTDNRNFKALVTVIPVNGSLSASTVDTVANYQPPAPQAACNGQTHKQLVILYAAKNAGEDSVTIRAGSGKEVVDLVFQIKAE
jgi:hypothetical protein